MMTSTIPSESVSKPITDWTPASMLEILLNEPDDFLKVRETLSRIGVASKKEENTLYQSCHILHKQSHYFIVHFKELFLLDNKEATFTEDDLARRNTIAQLLSDWGLLEIADAKKAEPKVNLRQIKILSHKEKANWKLCVKYTLGKFKSKR